MGRVVLENVTKSFGETQVIPPLHLTIEDGEFAVFVGPSGCGKSTLLRLIAGLEETTSGQILIDGQDIQNYSPATLRSVFSVVLQNPLLFASSIRENIALGNSSASEADILAAARLAEVDEFVLQMPELFETQIGERSTTLSRGQRQRIAIARAALAGKNILLLDEPTTGLDENNQKIVSEALLDLAQDKTTLMITHDPKMADRADEIVYMSVGKVAEHGTHKELLEKNGPYAELFQ